MGVKIRFRIDLLMTTETAHVVDHFVPGGVLAKAGLFIHRMMGKKHVFRNQMMGKIYGNASGSGLGGMAFVNNESLPDDTQSGFTGLIDLRVDMLLLKRRNKSGKIVILKVEKAPVTLGRVNSVVKPVDQLLIC